jgi:hypothetical protein
VRCLAQGSGKCLHRPKCSACSRCKTCVRPVHPHAVHRAAEADATRIEHAWSDRKRVGQRACMRAWTSRAPRRVRNTLGSRVRWLKCSAALSRTALTSHRSAGRLGVPLHEESHRRKGFRCDPRNTGCWGCEEWLRVLVRELAAKDGLEGTDDVFVRLFEQRDQILTKRQVSRAGSSPWAVCRPEWTGPEEPGAPSPSAGLTTKDVD